MTIAKVEPLTNARALRGPFDYRLPAEMEGLEVGSIVRVPFGHRRVLGVVVERAESSELPPERLAEPLEALEAGAPAELVRLGLWIGREYCSTPSRGLELVLPPGTGVGGQRVRSRVELRAEIAPAGEAALSGSERLGVRQRAALEALREAGEMSAAGLAAAVGADRQVLRRLEQRGLIATRSSRLRRAPEHRAVGAAGERPRLLPEQERAAEEIVAAIDGVAGAERELLLHGVTGSGKTEVYLAAVEAALARGRTAIVLVPEIGLAPQAVARFRARLGDRVAVLHSALSDGERYDEWRRLRGGEASVCVGPRSAVFAPLADLGLLVVDEEHDPSYKQEGDPCYDARAVARHRARECGAVLVAGTATPRPETWLELPRLEMPRRVDGRGMPPVEVLDMRATDPRGGPLHPATLEALGEVRAAGAKAIVMINRRGFAPWLTCRSCGRHWDCPNCDVSLIVHRHSGRLVCHHCAHSEPLPAVCGECGSTTLSRAGAGTEQIEALLAERLAPMPVFRLDSDTVVGEGRPRRDPRPLRRGGERRPGRHPDGRQGPRLPRGHPERDPRRRRDPALPRLPRRRAHLRDGRPARRALRPRRGRGARARADAGARRRQHRPCRRATTRPASSPVRSSGGGRCATRPSRTWSGSCSAAEDGAAPRAGLGEARRRRCRERCPGTPTCSARRRCSASAAATAAGSWSRPTTARRRSPPSRAAVDGLAADRAASARRRDRRRRRPAVAARDLASITRHTIDR